MVCPGPPVPWVERSSLFVLGSTNAFTVFERSLAEIPVVHPFPIKSTETVNAVSVTGGHLGASLGVIELTIAIHYVFNTPNDRLVWDVGHQAYPHKILTGRRDKIKTLRQKNGLYGFTKRTESEYDPFGAAHASTAMSSGLGMAIARDLMKKKNHVICVVGDGAMSGGMAYELSLIHI